MAYGDSNAYNKFQDCDCDSSESCDCNSNDCGCCPIGTVEVTDSCGKSIGCLTPNDASQYYYDTLDVPEGFVKVKDSDGNYVGILTVAEYCEYITCAGTSAAAGFNTISGVENTISQAFVSTTPLTSSDIQAIIDRFGVNTDITVSLVMPTVSGVSITGVSKTIDAGGAITTSGTNIILEGSSLFIYQIVYDGTANAPGTYYGVVKFSGGGVDRYVKITLTFS